MKALILAAGEGTRMLPLTANMPKPLLPVAGKPFLQHLIEGLRNSGIKDIIILVGWRRDKVKDYFGDGSDFGVNIEYFHQEKRLGTAHAVSMIVDAVDSDFICVNGDVLVGSKTIGNFMKFYKKEKSPVLSVSTVDAPENYGVALIEDGVIVDIVEKPKERIGNKINAGLYMFPREIFDAISKTSKSPRGEYEIVDSIKMLMRSMDMKAYEVKDDWIDVGYPWSLLKANEILMRDIRTNIEGDVEKGAVIKGNVQIGSDTIVRSGSYIVGPAIIGKGSFIGPNCYIRASTMIGDGCHIGAGVEIKNTIVMNNSNVPHLNYVGDSVIGERCNLGAGTKVANLRLDNRNIKATVKGKRIDTGLRKLGAIIGDDVKTGINASIDVGTIISEEAFLGPGVAASGFIAPRSQVL